MEFEVNNLTDFFLLNRSLVHLEIWVNKFLHIFKNSLDMSVQMTIFVTDLDLY